MKKDKSRTDKRNRRILYVLAITVLIIFALLIVDAILDIGSRLRNISEYLEYGFYGFMVLFIIFGIIRPIVIIVRSPSLSIATATDTTHDEAVRIYKRVAKVIVKNNDLPEEQKIMLVNYHNPDELLFNISYVFEKTIKKQMNGIIITNAKTVMISTAICQNGKFDMMTVFAVNLRMIKQMVTTCGFRPSMKNLSKLTLNVFATALIADGLENLTINDVMPRSALNAISEIPMLGKILESFIDGAANALLTCRIGCVCRRYLYSDGAVVTKEDIRRNAYKETLLLIPQVTWATASFFPKKIVKFFTKNNEDKEVNVDAE